MDQIQNLNNFADLVHFKNKYEGKAQLWRLQLFKHGEDVHAEPISVYYTEALNYKKAMQKFGPYLTEDYVMHSVSNIQIPVIPKVI